MGRDDRPSDSIEARATRRVRRKLGFYTHAAVFVAVNLGFFVMHELSGRAHKPFMFWGWGLGLFIHGVFTFVSLQGEGVRERMIRHEIERMRRERGEDDKKP